MISDKRTLKGGFASNIKELNIIHQRKLENIFYYIEKKKKTADVKAKLQKS